MSWALYIAGFFAAVGLYLMMPRRGYNPRWIGALLGAMSLGGLWLWVGRDLPADVGLSGGAWPYYYLFSALAIAAAVRVITHTRPVYAALWFVMVVLASAGLLLVLNAEFIAFALVIIYGGAILVTYVFVIMLASEAGDLDDADAGLEYDRVARAPVAAIAAGFVLLAALLNVAFAEPGVTHNAAAQGPRDDEIISETLTHRAAQRLADQYKDSATPQVAAADLTALDNVERVGLDLFQSHPLGLELAGVILLVSLVGAVVIAKQRVEEVSDQ